MKIKESEIFKIMGCLNEVTARSTLSKYLDVLQGGTKIAINNSITNVEYIKSRDNKWNNLESRNLAETMLRYFYTFGRSCFSFN